MPIVSREFRELAASSSDELETVLRDGLPPSIESLLGYEYKGFNHPRFTALFGARKFIKGFFSAGGRAFGFNVRAKQNGINDDWIARPDDAHPRRFAFFSVAPVQKGRRDAIYPKAFLLDYGEGKNRAHDPAGLLRDYLVRVNRGSDDLLLGKAYFALASARIPVAFFLLERHRRFEVGSALERRVLPS